MMKILSVILMGAKYFCITLLHYELKSVCDFFKEEKIAVVVSID